MLSKHGSLHIIVVSPGRVLNETMLLKWFILDQNGAEWY